MIDNKKYTSLYNEHINLDAKMVDFAGFVMPVNYKKGIQYEYNAVRTQVGIFDVSHMGEIFVSGEEAASYLQYMTINDVGKLKLGDAQYNVICNPNGGIKDDIIIYCIKNGYILIVNASNCEKIFNWLSLNNKFNCIVEDNSEKYSLIAVQGPKSRKLISEIFNTSIDLGFYKHTFLKYNSKNILLSRTGYTGELGYEILGDHNSIVKLWKALIQNNAIPCGLAVRDILRLEMKYCLYGNDINEETSPIESNLDWVVNFNSDFLGSKSLLDQKKNGVKRKLVAFKMKDKCVPRKGYDIFYKNEKIGVVTSGTFSLSLKVGIGMGYIQSAYSKINSLINLKIRGKDNIGVVVKPPFIKEFSLHD